MPDFVLKAHAAPVDPGLFASSVNQGGRVEFLAQCVLNALFLSKGHREDVKLHLVLESSKDYSRTLTLDGAGLGTIAGLDETSILNSLRQALSEGARLAKGEGLEAQNGIRVACISFEALLKQFSGRPFLLLDLKGTDIRDTSLPEDAVYILTDHVPMNRNTTKHLVRLGAEKVSLGPFMLHASQCITVIHNEIDRQA